MSFNRGGFARGGGAGGAVGARGGFGTANAAPAKPATAAGNDDWGEEGGPAPATTNGAARAGFGGGRGGAPAINGTAQENGSGGGRFGSNGSNGFAKGEGGADFGDQQQNGGGSQRGGFAGRGSRFGSSPATEPSRNGGGGETNGFSAPRGMATGGNNSTFGPGRGQAFGANRGGADNVENGGQAHTNGEDAPARGAFGGGRGGSSMGSRGGFGGTTNGDQQNGGGGENEGGARFGGGRGGRGRFGGNSDENGDSAGGARGGRFGRADNNTEEGGASSGFGGGRFGATANDDSNAEGGGGRYANAGAGGGNNNCFNCNQPGHRSAECTEPRAPRAGGADMKCYNCQGNGHMSRDCTEPKQDRPPREPREGGGAPRSCFNCGQEGHVSRDCTQPREPRADGAAGGAANIAFDMTYTDTKPSHVPVMRTIDDIFEEDAKESERYLDIRTDDDEILVTGLEEGTVPTVIENWTEANLNENVMANIERAMYVRPRKIQSFTIPLIMDGHDIKGHAETGSGKTAAFLLPIIDSIIKKKVAGDMKSERSKPIALIIEPTRELAVQLHDQARKLCEGTGVSVAVAYGKYQLRDNLRAISLGCDILVGTVGRLKDFILRRYVLVENIKYLVLDEADQLLEDQFMRELRDIAGAEKFPKKEDRQTLLFSATFPEEVQQWANEWMREKNVMVSNKKPASANHKVIQEIRLVGEGDKKNELLKMLQDELKEAKEKNPENEAEAKIRKTMVFVKLKRTCDVLCAWLQQNDLTCTTVNGDRTQELREKCLEQLRKNEVQVVIATDVCARGLDIKNLDHVINLDLPDNFVTYVHRIGRTGRLKEGFATSFFDPNTDMELVDGLIKGLQEGSAEVPEFLQKAKDGTLEFAPPPSADDEIPSGSGAGFGQAAAGGAAPAATADNDEWE